MPKKSLKAKKIEAVKKEEKKEEIKPSKVEEEIKKEDAKLKKEDDFSKLTSSLPREAQEKLASIKEKIDKFQKKALEKFDKYIMAIALAPPPQQLQALKQPAQPPQKEEEKINPDQINILILIDDSDSKKMMKDELKNKLSAIMSGIAKEIDLNLVPQTIILTELWQNCFDGKYELLQVFAVSAPIYDLGMLAAIKIAEIHKTMVLKKFERYIVSYVLAGSLIQGRATQKSDIDVFIVIDDTDVKRMTRAELKDKLRAIIIGMGIEAGEITGIRNKLNIQVYILTDFWDSIREANPIIFTFLRDGVPFYDRGIFMPWKQLLHMGKIKPSAEAIEIYMSTGEQMLNRVRFKMKEIGMEDTFWAILTPSQAALMLYGVPPPTPKETPDIMRDIFVKKEKLLEEEYVEILENNIKLRKELEHGDRKELSGKEVDELLKNSDKYLKRIDKLFQQIEKVKREEDMLKVYETTVNLVRDVLKAEGIDEIPEHKLEKIFEDGLITTGKLPVEVLRTLREIIKAKMDYDDKKLTKPEVESIKKDSAAFNRQLIEYIQRKRGRELERAKIRVKYGDKYGEVLLLEKEAYITYDIDAQQKEVSRAPIKPDGSLGSVQKSSIEDMEKAISTAQVPKNVFIKEPIFENLKDIFGRNVEVLMNY